MFCRKFLPLPLRLYAFYDKEKERGPAVTRPSDFNASWTGLKRYKRDLSLVISNLDTVTIRTSGWRHKNEK